MAESLPTIGASRTGAPRTGTGVTRSTPTLDATAKWLAQISGVHTVDLGGISEESRRKIAYGLEARGRPVTKVTPYMVGRMVTRAQRWLGTVARPTKDAFWDVVDGEALGVIRERLAGAGGDLAGEWAAHPLTPAYAKEKARTHPGRPMGQRTGALLRDVRSAGAFAVSTGGRR